VLNDDGELSRQRSFMRVPVFVAGAVCRSSFLLGCWNGHFYQLVFKQVQVGAVAMGSSVLASASLQRGESRSVFLGYPSSQGVGSISGKYHKSILSFHLKQGELGNERVAVPFHGRLRAVAELSAVGAWLGDSRGSGALSSSLAGSSAAAGARVGDVCHLQGLGGGSLLISAS